MSKIKSFNSVRKGSLIYYFDLDFEIKQDKIAEIVNSNCPDADFNVINYILDNGKRLTINENDEDDNWSTIDGVCYIATDINVLLNIRKTPLCIAIQTIKNELKKQSNSIYLTNYLENLINKLSEYEKEDFRDLKTKDKIYYFVYEGNDKLLIKEGIIKNYKIIYPNFALYEYKFELANNDIIYLSAPLDNNPISSAQIVTNNKCINGCASINKAQLMKKRNKYVQCKIDELKKQLESANSSLKNVNISLNLFENIQKTF